jgi:hypothetical protein
MVYCDRGPTCTEVPVLSIHCCPFDAAVGKMDVDLFSDDSLADGVQWNNDSTNMDSRRLASLQEA